MPPELLQRPRHPCLVFQHDARDLDAVPRCLGALEAGEAGSGNGFVNLVAHFVERGSYVVVSAGMGMRCSGFGGVAERMRMRKGDGGCLMR